MLWKWSDCPPHQEKIMDWSHLSLAFVLWYSWPTCWTFGLMQSWTILGHLLLNFLGRWFVSRIREAPRQYELIKNWHTVTVSRLSQYLSQLYVRNYRRSWHTEMINNIKIAGSLNRHFWKSGFSQVLTVLNLSTVHCYLSLTFSSLGWYWCLNWDTKFNTTNHRSHLSKNRIF